VSNTPPRPATAGEPELLNWAIAVAPLLGAGALLVVAGVGRVVSYLAPYEPFGISLAFRVIEILGWVGAFLSFLAAGYPSRRSGARVLTLVLVGLYTLGGIVSIGIALNPSAPPGWFTVIGMLGFAAFGVGIAFAVSAIRTPGLAVGIRFLPLALYLGLMASGLIVGVAASASSGVGAVGAIVLTAVSGLVPATVGALFIAYGRHPHASVD
jgi:hypothetical protein